MSFEKSTGPRVPRPQYNKSRPQNSGPRPASRSSSGVNGSAQQKHTQWLSRMTDAERAGDTIEAENCRQHAEHWFRVSRGQD
ncbi:DUF4167 domain-containing protein [Azospirillum doebereinerae]